MADMRRRSPRTRRRRSPRQPGADSTSMPPSRQRPAGEERSRVARTRRPGSPQPSAAPRSSGYQGSPSTNARNGTASNGGRSRAGRPGDPSRTSALVHRPAGAITRTPSTYRGRDGRRVGLGPDPRRPQVGAYATALGGRRRSPVPPRREQPPNTINATAISAPAPRRNLQSAFPGARAAGTDRPVQRLSPRPVVSSRRRRPPQRRRPRRPASPLVYLVRLLILGVGIGAIAGTVISALNPSLRESQATDPDAQTEVGAEAGLALSEMTQPPESGRSLVTSLPLRQEMRSLSQDIQTLTEAYPDLNTGVFIYDLDTGDYLNLNGGAPIAAASTIKVPILVAFLQEVDAGGISFDERLTIEEEDVATGSGSMQFEPVGTDYTALETATQMIIISDNTATNMLIRRLGGMNELNRRFKAWGLSYTTLNNLLPDLEGTNTTSPQELVEIMTLVSREELLTSRSRDRLLHIMSRTQTDTLLPQGLSSDAEIFHKTGDIGSMLGDVGLVDAPNGKRYAIAVQVERPHNDARARELIQRISTAVYDAMSAVMPTESEDTSSTPNSSLETTPDEAGTP